MAPVACTPRLFGLPAWNTDVAENADSNQAAATVAVLTWTEAPQLRSRCAALGPAHPVHRVDLVLDSRAGDAGRLDEPSEQGLIGALHHVAPSRALVLGVPGTRGAAAIPEGARPLMLAAHVDGGPRAPLRHAFADGGIQLGVRGGLPSLEFDRFSRSSGVTLWTPDDLSDRGPDALAGAARDAVGGDPLFVSVDLSVFDPAHAPGVGSPPGGLTPREVFRFLRNLEGTTVAAAALTGFPDDPAPLAPVSLPSPTLDLAAQTAQELLALLALSPG